MRAANRGRDAGFTLAELMVGMLIGLLVLAGVTTLFLHTSRSNREMTRTNALIENGAFAMQILRNDLVHAGFWGGFVPAFDDLSSTAVPTDVPDAVPDFCAVYDATSPLPADKSDFIGIPVQSYTLADSDGDDVPEVPDGCEALIADPQADTDLLLIRYVASCVAASGATDPECDYSDNNLYIQVSNCRDIDEGCFTSAGTTVLEPAYRLEAKPSADPDDTFDLREKDGTTLAEKRKFISHLYYVRNYAETAGDGIPTLMRTEFDYVTADSEWRQLAATPLIEGIEGFQVRLGIDTVGTPGVDGSGAAVTNEVDYGQAVEWLKRTAASTRKTVPRYRGDGAPDLYKRCATIDTAACPDPATDPDDYLATCCLEDFPNVVAVRLDLLVRADEETPGYANTMVYTNFNGGEAFGDGYKRQQFSASVRLNNISQRRETP